MQEIYGFELKQGIGSKSDPVVMQGATIKRGELIAKRPENQLGNNIHASISGVVEELTDEFIFIKANSQQSNEYVELTSESSIDLIREAGIIGLGGAGFPTDVKLAHPFKEDGTILINAAECEPILNHNIQRIEQHADDIIRGISIVINVTNASKAIIGIKESHVQAIQALENKLIDEHISIHILPDLYPMGDERALVRECLGILIKVDELPSVANAIVINAETVFRIQETVDFKKPLIDKDITVAGKLTENGAIKVFLDIPLGTSVREIFDKAGGLGSEYGEIIKGGPFTGCRADLTEYISKTTGGLIATETFWKGPDKLGLLVCACGASEDRLKEVAESMGSQTIGVEYCKQAIKVKGGWKCENPGICPGQVQKVMALKKAGAQGVLISNCTDCSNTVMSVAPKLKLPVYHVTDGALRAANIKLIRRIKN